jgi:hypothetical protein
VAQEFELTAQPIRNWVGRAAGDADRVRQTMFIRFDVIGGFSSHQQREDARSTDCGPIIGA